LILGDGLPQMFAIAKLANRMNRVKPEALRQRGTKSGGLETSNFRRRAEVHLCDSTSTISTARCGPACRVVWEGSVRFTDRPYPDFRSPGWSGFVNSGNIPKPDKPEPKMESVFP
jgi:hypothetical protein